MTDEQYAAADRRYRRRWLAVTVGYLLVGLAQLANVAFGDGSGLALAAGVGFLVCSVGGGVAWRRGMPDTRRAGPNGGTS